MNYRTMLIVVVMLAVSLFVLTNSLFSAKAANLPKVDQTWACGSGFPPCTTENMGVCSPAPQPYLKMSSNQYSFTFTAPKAANYTCMISATASHFDYQSTLQTNEVTDVYLNSKKVGTTLDSWCPPGGVTEPPQTCTNNVPGDVGMIDNGCKFLEYGTTKMSQTKFCKKGHATFRVPKLGNELEAGNEEKIVLMFVLGNTKNRNLVSGRAQYLESENRFIVKIGGGSCNGCWSCCYCVGQGTMNDAFCGSQVFRPQCPTFDPNADSQDFKISWYPTQGKIGNGNGYGIDVCIQKVGEQGKVCFNDSFGIIQDPPGIVFNSYCTAPDHCHEERLPDRFFSEQDVTLVDFGCEVTTETVPCSCYVNGVCVGTSSTGAACESDGTPPPPPTCNNDGICGSGENPLNCPNDCEYKTWCNYIKSICRSDGTYGTKGQVQHNCDSDEDCAP